MAKAEERYSIRDGGGKLVEVDFRRDRRLKKTSRWERQADGTLLLRVPYRFPRHRVSSLLDQIASQLENSRKRHARRRRRLA